MTAPGGNVNVKAMAGARRLAELTSPNTSNNPFLVDIRGTAREDVDSVNQMNFGRIDEGDSGNPFVTSMELTLAAREAAAHTLALPPSVAWPLTPPSSVSANPFRTPAERQFAADGELNVGASYKKDCDCSRNVTSTPATHYGTGIGLSQAAALIASSPIVNHFIPVNYSYHMTNPELPPAHTAYHQQTLSPCTQCIPLSVRHGPASQAQGHDLIPPCDALLLPGRQPECRRTRPALRGCSSHVVHQSEAVDSSDEELCGQREWIPTQ